MKRIVAGLTLVVALFAWSGAGLADQADADKAEIHAAIASLIKAFEISDEAAIRDMMTEDHIAVSPNYGRAYSVDDQVGTLGDLEYNVTDVANETVTLLDDEVALVSATVRVEGSFQGEDLPGHIYVTQVWVKQDGKWKQKLYQETAIDE